MYLKNLCAFPTGDTNSVPVSLSVPVNVLALHSTYCCLLRISLLPTQLTRGGESLTVLPSARAGMFSQREQLVKLVSYLACQRGRFK